uniref:Uncharacterized protein n=1 Tax=Toxoplasma gondii COUG TaxID=1074873 RepID=A0A2G8XVW3_TOXGO|nr:hypothetical protein TGCOUG_222100 [Toxoplasma gondii COUG]
MVSCLHTKMMGPAPTAVRFCFGGLRQGFIFVLFTTFHWVVDLPASPVEGLSPIQKSFLVQFGRTEPSLDQSREGVVAAFKFESLRQVFQASRGEEFDNDTVRRTVLLGRQTFDSIMQQTLSQHSDNPTEARLHSGSGNHSPLPSFTIDSISTMTLGGIESLQFFCSVDRVEGSEDSAIRCIPQPQALPGSLRVGFIFQLLPSTDKVFTSQSSATSPPFCRIVHDSTRSEFPSFLDAAIGICAAFGYENQLIVQDGNPALDLLPDLYPEGLPSKGFESVPARYVKPYHSLSFVGLKPVDAVPSENHKHHSQADFLPNEELDTLSWRGVAVSSSVYEKALGRLKAAVRNAVISEATEVRDCTLHVGRPAQYEAVLKKVAGSACLPGKNFLQCLDAIRMGPYVQEAYLAMHHMRRQIEQLTPRISPSAAQMLSTLTERETWQTLHSLIGPQSARLFETPSQTAWYEEGMLKVKQHTARTDVSLVPSSETLISEALRFPLWFLDIFPSSKYWQDLKLGCVLEDLAYLSEMGRVFIRRSPRRLEYPIMVSTSRIEKPAALLQEDATELRGKRTAQELVGYDGNDTTSESVIASAEVFLPSGKRIRPLQRVYAFEDLKAISNINPAQSDNDEAVRRLWLSSPVFEEREDITVTGVPARDKGTFDLRFLCTKRGRFRVSENLIGWFSKYLCEPEYVPVPDSEYTGELRQGDLPVNRLIGIEFEDHAPWRCGVSFLGTQRQLKETAVRGSDLLKIMTGLCSLVGFKTGWILDSVTDLSAQEMMKITMVLEKRISFYENQGFLLSINTIKSREQMETCTGSSAEDPTTLLSGVCKQPHDILMNPGFEATTFYTLFKRAYDTLYNLTFDCNSPSWQNCGKAFPLSVKDHRGGGCAFERHPLFHELKYLNPEKCGTGKRIGECHEFVRKHLKCNRHEKNGCKYLVFLHTQFLYPGGNVERKLPKVVQDQYEIVGKDIHKEAGPLLFEAIRKSAREELSRISSGQPVGTTELWERQDGTASDGEQRAAMVSSVRDMLLESLIFVDWSGTPQFWIRAQYDYDAKTGMRREDKDNLFCPVAYAWAYITRLHGQLYRHSSDYFNETTPRSAPKSEGQQDEELSPLDTATPQDSSGIESNDSDTKQDQRPVERHHF